MGITFFEWGKIKNWNFLGTFTGKTICKWWSHNDLWRFNQQKKGFNQQSWIAKGIPD